MNASLSQPELMYLHISILTKQLPLTGKNTRIYVITVSNNKQEIRMPQFKMKIRSFALEKGVLTCVPFFGQRGKFEVIS